MQIVVAQPAGDGSFTMYASYPQKFLHLNSRVVHTNYWAPKVDVFEGLSTVNLTEGCGDGGNSNSEGKEEEGPSGSWD